MAMPRCVPLYQLGGQPVREGSIQFMEGQDLRLREPSIAGSMHANTNKLC